MLPSGEIGLGTYNLIAAFPNLIFPDALFLAGVPGENRLVVVRQSGRVHAFDNDPATVTSSIVFDLSSRVLFGGEQGLLGLAFDPGFVVNRTIYVHYSAANPRRSVISRFTWSAACDTVDLTSEKMILVVNQPFSNHNGGMLAFGPDDYLYVGMGDGGSGGDPNNNAQNPSNPLGSMLRIDVHPANSSDPYDVPIDNPFIGQPDFMAETYAYGLRNPFRYSFDRQTGDLWLGDVGQGNWEEIDVVTAGGNYGWRVFEGTQEFDNSGTTPPNSTFIPPIFEYSHASGGVAIIGGYVYRGNLLPGLQGRYLYADFGSGALWALRFDGANVLSNDQIAQANTPTSFGEDNQGELYVVSNNGTISQLEEASGGGNLPDLLSETGLFGDLGQLT
ncbi:MAG: sorbosone dehydrogenase family protein, partial [Pseudomonadales bacterium]